MQVLRRTKLYSRLVSAFLVCAIITLGVGFLGYLGITKQKEAIDGIVSNNLVSVYNTANARASVFSYSRSLHAALLYKYAKEDVKFDAAVQSMSDSEKEVDRLSSNIDSHPLRMMSVRQLISLKSTGRSICKVRAQ